MITSVSSKSMRRTVLGADAARFGRSARFEHGVAAISQDTRRDLAHGGVVFDDQERARCGVVVASFEWRACDTVGLSSKRRKVDLERGAVPELTVARGCARRSAERCRTRWPARARCPCPTSLVVKKGSKMRRWVSASMPVPESVTASITYSPGGMSMRALSLFGVEARRFAWRSRSCPPPCMASRALIDRFRIT